MAAPTMQPVKNFAFIKCGSFMEYDCLPAYLKGQDQFIFADIPTSRPSIPNTEWFDSTDPDYPSANGWTMIIQYEDNPDSSFTNGWTETTMYIGFWNTTTNDHAAKRIRGARYTNFVQSTYASASVVEQEIPRPYANGRVFLTDVDAEVFEGGEFWINRNNNIPAPNESVIKLSSVSATVGATYVGGSALGTPMFKIIPLIEAGDEYNITEIPIFLYKAEASFGLFAEDPSATDNVGTLVECSGIVALSTLTPSNYLKPSDGWQSLAVGSYENLFADGNRTISVDQDDGYEYEFAAVLTNNLKVTDVTVSLGSQWNRATAVDTAEYNVESSEVVRSEFCTIYKFGSWRFLDSLQYASYHLTTGLFANCRVRGSAIFYRKRASETGKLLKNIVMIAPFFWKASRTDPNRANRAEISAPTNSPIRLVAARVINNYDSSATAAPATTYTEMRFGNPSDGSDSKYKTINQLITGTSTYWQKYGALDNGVKLLGSHETPNIWMSQAFKIVPGTGISYSYFNAWKTANVTINSSNATYSTFSSDNDYTYGLMYTLRQFVRNSRRKTIRFIHSTHNSVSIAACLFETGVAVPESKYIIVDWYSSSDPTGFIELYYSTVDSPSLIAADFETYAHICKDRMSLLKSYTGASASGAVKERKVTYFVDSEDPTHKYCVFIVPDHSVPVGGTDKLLLVTSDTSLVEANISVADNQLGSDLTADGVKLHDNETVYGVSYDLLM